MFLLVLWLHSGFLAPLEDSLGIIFALYFSVISLLPTMNYDPVCALKKEPRPMNGDKVVKMMLMSIVGQLM